MDDLVDGQFRLPPLGGQDVQADGVATVGRIKQDDVVQPILGNAVQHMGDEVGLGLNDHQTKAGREVSFDQAGQ